MKLTAITIALAALICGISVAAVARSFQDDPQDGGYKVGENSQQPPPPSAPSSTRLARFEYSTGNVTWRLNDRADWSPVHIHATLTPGSQIWTVGEGKVEILFEDGGLLRLGRGAVARTETLYADKEGGYTRVVVNSGSAMLSLSNNRAVYEVVTPNATTTVAGPARVRIDADGPEGVFVRSGKATLKGPQGTLVLASGEYVSLAKSDTAYRVRTGKPYDSWDRWNDERDHVPVARRSLGPGATIFTEVILGSRRRHRDYYDGRRW